MRPHRLPRQRPVALHPCARQLRLDVRRMQQVAQRDERAVDGLAVGGLEEVGDEVERGEGGGGGEVVLDGEDGVAASRME